MLTIVWNASKRIVIGLAILVVIIAIAEICGTRAVNRKSAPGNKDVSVSLKSREFPSRSMIRYYASYSSPKAANTGNAFRLSLLNRFKGDFSAMEQFCDSTLRPSGAQITAGGMNFSCDLVQVNDLSGPTGPVRQHRELFIHGSVPGQFADFTSWEVMLHDSPAWNLRQTYLAQQTSAHGL